MKIKELFHSLIVLAVLLFTFYGCGDGGGGASAGGSGGGNGSGGGTSSGGGGNGGNENESLSGVHWAKTFGGSNDDGPFFVSTGQTGDGGFTVAGTTGSFSAVVYDIWVFKLKADGSFNWQKRYGSTGFDGASYVQQTTDGGYIVAGNTESFGAILNDFWVLKLDTNGNITWQKKYGGPVTNISNFIQQTTDGGYIIAGQTTSFGAGNTDLWILKIDSDGDIVPIGWEKTYGGINNDSAIALKQTSDGGYIIAGHTNSFGAGGYDFWLLKVNSTGNLTNGWQKAFGGTGNDFASFVEQTSDGGYIVAGQTNSFGAGETDIWILKLDPNGVIQFQKTFGGAKSETANSVRQTDDGGYIVAGQTDSFGAGNKDVWIIKLNSDGLIDWQKTYGGSGDETAYSIQQTSDGGYVAAGSTDSFGAGNTDIWVLRLRSDGTVSPVALSNIGTDTSATVFDTAVNQNGTKTNITPGGSAAIVISTGAAGVNSTAVISTQITD